MSFTIKKGTCDARGARTACSSCILQLMKLEESSSRSRSLEYDRSFYNCRLDNENLPNVGFPGESDNLIVTLKSNNQALKLSLNSMPFDSFTFYFIASDYTSRAT